MAFAGIIGLRSMEDVIEYEPWMLIEIQKCATDPIYFIENYIKITSLDHGLIPFKLYDFQKDVIKDYQTNRFHIQKWPRQCGKSTTARSFLLWHAMFNKRQSIMMLANKQDTIKEQLAGIKESYIGLPEWLQIGVKQWNKKTVELGNGSKISCAATSPDNIRGYSVNILYLDEFAIVPNHKAEEFMKSAFPTISSGKGSKIIITSTPKGMNHFFRMWEKGTDDKNQKEMFLRNSIPWNAVPGRDRAWAEKIRATEGETSFQQEYACSFIGSDTTLIDHNFLPKLKPKDPLKIPNLPEYVRIYKLPLNEHYMEANNFEYAASIDTGMGVYKDYTVLQIVLIKNSINVHQVLSMSSNSMDVELFANRANALLKKYHSPNLIIEQNGPGGEMIRVFRTTYDYEGIVNFDKHGLKFGLWATVRLKQTACVLYKSYIQRKFLKLYDYDTINELFSFGQLTQTTWGATGGNNDDHTTSMYWIIYYIQTPYFNGNVVEVDMSKLGMDEICLPTQDELKQEKLVLSDLSDPEFSFREASIASQYQKEGI